MWSSFEPLSWKLVSDKFHIQITYIINYYYYSYYDIINSLNRSHLNKNCVKFPIFQTIWWHHFTFCTLHFAFVEIETILHMSIWKGIKNNHNRLISIICSSFEFFDGDVSIVDVEILNLLEFEKRWNIQWLIDVLISDFKFK